jgi:hypothetical protein
LLNALRKPPRHEIAFRVGAEGERNVAASLEKRTAPGSVVLLHDRRMPGGRGNIDHLAITPNGVFVIDTKSYSGTVRISNPLFGRSKLAIAGRDSTELIDGLDRQVSAIRDALTTAGRTGIDVHGVLCFARSDLPLLRTLKMRGHILLTPKPLARRLNRDGPLPRSAIDSLADSLATAFPAA